MRTTERTFAPALAPAGKAETQIFTFAVAKVKSVLRGLRNRQALHALSEMDEFHLRDIGLDRRDVDRALEDANLLQDPFTLLPRAARQRGAKASGFKRQI